MARTVVGVHAAAVRQRRPCRPQTPALCLFPVPGFRERLARRLRAEKAVGREIFHPLKNSLSVRPTPDSVVRYGQGAVRARPTAGQTSRWSLPFKWLKG